MRKVGLSWQFHVESHLIPASWGDWEYGMWQHKQRDFPGEDPWPRCIVLRSKWGSSMQGSRCVSMGIHVQWFQFWLCIFVCFPRVMFPYTAQLMVLTLQIKVSITIHHECISMCKLIKVYNSNIIHDMPDRIHSLTRKTYLISSQEEDNCPQDQQNHASQFLLQSQWQFNLIMTLTSW